MPIFLMWVKSVAHSSRSSVQVCIQASWTRARSSASGLWSSGQACPGLIGAGWPSISSRTAPARRR